MNPRRLAKLPRSLLWAPAFVASNFAAAGPSSVPYATVGPVSSVPVPTMSSGVLIALGIVLAVVAIRVLKHSAINQRIAGAFVLGGGLLAAGLGVQDSLATGAFLNVSGDSCSSMTTINVDPSTLLEDGNSIENQCAIDLEIKSYEFTCAPPSVFIDAGAPVGTIIAAGATAGGRDAAFGTAYCDSAGT